MNRRVLALLALAALVFLSGCSAFGGGGLDEDDLLGDQEYDWESNTTATYDLSTSSDSYAAVLELSNQSELSIHRSTTFRGDQSVSIGDLKFQFQNGTVVNATHPGLTASEDSDETDITVPDPNGTVAWTAGRSGKDWSTPVFVEGSYQVRLPESTRVGIPLLSRTGPSPDRTTTEDDQMTLYWSEIEDGSISIRYYIVRDLYIFGGVAIVALLLGMGGTVYYLREIRSAQKKREQVGLDVEEDDDVEGDGPPPGMR
jgi:hypothetical protein